MAHSIESQTASSPSAELRADLEELEKLLIKVNAVTVERTLKLLDKAHGQMEELRARGVDLKAEDGLWSGFEVKLQASAGEFVKAARNDGGIAALRSSHARTDGFWWRLDDIHRQQNRRTLMRYLRLGGVVAALLVGIWAIFTFVFPTDETIVMITDITHDLERAVDLGDLEAARDLAVQGLAPTDQAVELLLWASVLEDLLGNEQAGQAYLDQALTQTDVPPERIWVTVGNNRMRTGDLDGAECAALAALALEPEDPQAHFLIAGIAESLGDVGRAVEYFELTYELAGDAQPQLQVVSRVRLGYLMQSPSSLTAEEMPERQVECG